MKTKLFNLFIVFTVATLFIGCTTSKNSISKTGDKYSPNMSSKQVETQMKWKYCEQKAY